MQPQNFHFGGGSPSTVLHPLVAIGMLIAIVMILSLPRERAIAPFLLAYFTIPIGQVLVLGGVHLLMHQILILTVLARMASFHGPGGKLPGGFNALDHVAVLWPVSTFVMWWLQWMEMQAVIKSLGDLIISLGGYLALRFLIVDREALRRTLKALAVVCAIQGVCMVSELFTRQNVFNFAGALTPTIREGHVRAEGSLGGLYGGLFAGALVPLFIWLWKENKYRMPAFAGIAGATAMVFATHASTSLMAYAAGLLGLAFWALRKQMRLVRCALVATLVALHLVMHGPVWSLIEHIDLTGGSSSYHRYELVDNCIRHFGDWWMIGYKYYNEWGFCMFDLCDEWVAVAVSGGLLTFILFTLIYKRGFGSLGSARKRVQGDRRQEWFYWCLGSALFTYAFATIGVNFMYHLHLSFLCLVACISVAAFEVKRPAEPNVETRTQSSLVAVHHLVEV